MGQQDGVKREERVAEGVSLRRNAAGEAESFRISFMYRKVECRERLNVAPTSQNQQWAIRRRGEVLNAIERCTFNYADFFPESKYCARFGSTRSDLLMTEAIAAYKAQIEKTVEASTFRGYSRIIDGHLMSWFPGVRARDVNSRLVKDAVLKLSCTVKTARNILVPLNAIFEQLITDEVLDANPLDRIFLDKLIPKDQQHSDYIVDPFPMDEITEILAACHPGQEHNFWQHAFGSGMRPGERIALLLDRCDSVRGRMEVVDNVVTTLTGTVKKTPKTAAGHRWVDMRNASFEAIEAQRLLVPGPHAFHDPLYDKPWADEQTLRNRWKRILKNAGVRYRNPYQTRHTFASSLLAAGENPLYVARQLGHTTTEMVTRTYGRWIEQGENPETRAKLAWFFGRVSHLSPTAEVIPMKAA